MEVFKLFGSILIKSDEAEKSIQKTESKAQKLASTFGKGIKTAAKWGTGIAAGAGAAATATVGALLKVDESTKEYRENMGKLNAAWEASGKNAGLAQKAYKGLYGVIGDQDTATEAAQLMAQLAQSEEDVSKWTNIAAGAASVFGDSLPINSMVEYAAETAVTGTVTGDLARMLTTAGINEDEFNAKLAACSSEQERSKLITDTLAEAYHGASEAFKANNAEVMSNRDSQAKLDETMGKLGGAISTIKTKFLSEFMPAVADVTSAFVDFTMGVDGAEEQLQISVQNMVDKIAEKLPDFIDFGIDVIVAIATGLIRNLPYLLSKLPEIVFAIVKGFGQLGGELFTVGVELFEQLLKGLKSVWSGITSWVSEKVSWLKDKLSFWRSGQEEMRGDGFSHASGLSFVPYDNYPANLHRGEAVIDARGAQDLLNSVKALAAGGGNQEPITIVVQSVIDGKIVGESVTQYQRNTRRAYGV